MKKKGKILVLDDEQIVLDGVSRILEAEDYEVQAVTKASEALDTLKRGGLDVFLTDMKMPGMDQLQAMKSVSEIDPDLSVIMFSGYATVDSAVQAMRLGAADYMEKPFTPDRLADIVNKSIADRKARYEKRHREDAFEELKKVIFSTLNLREVLNLIVKGVVEIMKVKGSTLSLVDKRHGQLRIAAHDGLSGEYVNKGHLDASKSIGETIMNGKSVLIDDVAGDSRIQYPREALREGVKSILSVPLIVRNDVIGTLRAYTDKIGSFAEEEIGFFQGFAEQAAHAIENSRSFEAAKEEYEDLREDLWELFDKYGWL